MSTDDPLPLILHRLDAIETALTKVLEQTTATNGRVNKLEKWRERTEGAHEALGTYRTVTVIVSAGLIVAFVGAFIRYLATH